MSNPFHDVIRLQIRLQLAEGEVSIQQKKLLSAIARQDWAEVRVLELRKKRAEDKVARAKQALKEFALINRDEVAEC